MWEMLENYPDNLGQRIAAFRHKITCVMPATLLTCWKLGSLNHIS